MKNLDIAEDIAQVAHENVCILPYERPFGHPSESDEEIDGRLGLEVAGAVAAHGRAAFRPGADDELLPAGACEEGAAVEVFVVPLLVEPQSHGVHVANAEPLGERLDGLLDSGGNEVDDVPALAQRGDHLLGAVDERREIALRERVDRRPPRLDDLQPSRVHLVERHLAVHRGVRQLRDLGIASGEDVDRFDRDERGVDVEEEIAVVHVECGGRAAALTAAAWPPHSTKTISSKSENGSGWGSGAAARSASEEDEPVATTATARPLFRAACTSIGMSPTKSASPGAHDVAARGCRTRWARGFR